MNRCFAVALLFLSLAISSCNRGKKKPVIDKEESILYRVPIRNFSEAIDANPKSAVNYFRRGNALHAIREDSMALDDFNEAYRLDSTKAEYMSAIGELMFEHKDISGSRPWLEKALQANPNDVKAHLKLTKVWIFSSDYQRAMAEVNTVLRNDAYNAEGYFLKGIIYRELKDTGKAISSFQTSINVAPTYKDAMIQLGQLYNMQNNPLGMKYLDNAFKVDTTDLFPIYAKGMYYQDKGRYEEAKKEYRNCIEHDPQYVNAIFNMGFIFLAQDSLDKAYRQFDLATRIEPDNARGYYSRGFSSEKLGNKDAARKDYEQALVFKKDMPQALEGLKRLGN